MTWTARLIGVSFEDEARGEGEGEGESSGAQESTLPSSSAGLVVGTAMIAALTWIAAAVVGGARVGAGADPVAGLLLTLSVLLALLVAPSRLRPGAGLGRDLIGRRTAALHYTGFGLASLLAWSALVWLPSEAWAVLAAVAVLQSAYSIGIGLVALETHLAATVFDADE